ncbi:MAG: metallophosphoesterase [Verrucomicrobiota bacterium]
MKLLIVSDLHYSLRQYDWLARVAGNYDLVIIAGDLMELSSSVDSDTQAEVVAQYFGRIASSAPLVVCSGNHDLVEDYTGHRSVEWLEEVSIPGVVSDCGVYESDKLRILALPWWSGDEEKARVENWLALQAGTGEKKLTIWVHHVPPSGARVSWTGKRDAGSETLAAWINRFEPDLVFSGHVHNAPYYAPEGSWHDQVGGTLVINGGRQIGDQPVTVELEVDRGELRWCSLEGSETEMIPEFALQP